jgi:hypothetical protein
MSTLTPDRIHRAWAMHPASYLDSYGRAEQVKRLLLDPEEQGPRIRQACTWIEAQRHELGPFIEAEGYGWALDPACYRLGTEAFWQARILQQMSSLWRLEAAAGRPMTMMADVVVRQTFVTRYNLMSPRYWPSQGIHFVVLPVAYFDFAALIWLSFATWCRSARPGAGCNWSVATSLIAHPAPPSPGADPWLLGAIARYLAEAARDFDPDAPDAAAITARRSAFFSSAASDPEMDPADSFVADVLYALADFALAHELGHRAAAHLRPETEADYLAMELEADAWAFDFFRASWGWRAEVLAKAPFDDALQPLLGQLVFFHTTRLRGLMAQALARRAEALGLAFKGLGWGEFEQKRAVRLAGAAAHTLDVLRQGGAQITEDALARFHHLAANLAGFSERMVAICSTIPDAEFRLAFKPGEASSGPAFRPGG